MVFTQKKRPPAGVAFVQVFGKILHPQGAAMLVLIEPTLVDSGSVLFRSFTFVLAFGAALG